MQRFLKDIENASAQALLNIGDTVNIRMYDKTGSLVTLTDSLCIPFPAPDNNKFRWPYSNLDTIPEDFEEYTWIMDNGTGLEESDVDSFSPEDPRCFFSVPFDVDVSTLAINKGDSFEPEIRVDTNALGLNVVVLFSDGETSDSTNIYKATSDVADRGDGLPGGDDQVKLVAQGDTFQIFRIFLSGDETVLFDSRFVDMKITAETKDGKTQTVKKKIAFTEDPAINFDLVP